MANVGSPDRIVRGIVGVVLIALPYFTSFGLWSNELLRWGIPLLGWFCFSQQFSVFALPTGCLE